MSKDENQEMLTGGNVSNVYRSGDTIRRELKPDSANTHKLLKHWENKGFSYAPKFFGIDEKGREILLFIEGEADNYTILLVASKSGTPVYDQFFLDDPAHLIELPI